MCCPRDEGHCTSGCFWTVVVIVYQPAFAPTFCGTARAVPRFLQKRARFCGHWDPCSVRFVFACIGRMATQESSGAVLGDQPISTFGVLTTAPVITLPELSHVSDSYHQTPAGSKISSIQRLSPATWQGLATTARLLGFRALLPKSAYKL